MVSETFKKIALVFVVSTALFITACSGGGGGDTKEVTYKVKFHSSSVTGADTIEVSVNGGDTIPSADFPVDFAENPNDGREFLDWSVDPEGKGEVVNDETIIQSDLSLYPIWGSNISDLSDISSDLDGVYKLADDIVVPEGTEFEPIGRGPSSSFSGVIYGNGHTITGLALSAEKYTGLFGYIENAYISDIHIGLDSGSVEINSVTAAAGGLVGEAVDSTIANVSVSGDFNIESTGTLYAGLIAGKVENTSISNSFTTGNISAFAAGAVYAGGIAGYVDGSTADSNYVLGDIVSVTSSVMLPGSAYAGGVAGYAGAGSVVSKTVVASKNITSVNAGEIAGEDGGAELDGNYYKDAASTDVLDIEFFKSMGFDFDNAWAEPQDGKLYSLPVAKLGNSAVWIDVTFDTAGDEAVYKVVYDLLTNISPVPLVSDDFLLWNSEQDGRGDIVKDVKTAVPVKIYGILGKKIGSAGGFTELANEVGIDRHYMLMDDIDISSSGILQPIGDEVTPFTSVIYGNRHTITGIELADSPDTGLFGHIKGAYISDLALEANTKIAHSAVIKNAGLLAGVIGEDCIIDNVTVNGSIYVVSSAGELNVGGIAGTTDSDITNSAVNADIYGESASGQANAGGLVGLNSRTIANSYSTGAVQAVNNGSGEKKAQAGGIAGHNGTGGVITSTYSTADVTAEAATTDSHNHTSAGGIAGYNHGKVFATYATGKITANSRETSALTIAEHRANAGGIVGKSVGSVSVSYSTGDIESYVRNFPKSAGIVGDSDGNDNKIYRTVAANNNLTAANEKLLGIISYPSEINSGRIVGGCILYGIIAKGAEEGHNYANVNMKLNGEYLDESAINGMDKTMNDLLQRQTYEDLNNLDISGADDLKWDFENTWEIDEGKTLPTFQWQN